MWGKCIWVDKLKKRGGQENKIEQFNMALDLVESWRMAGRYWECPTCATKFYLLRAGEVLELFCLRGTCCHDICIRCIMGTACKAVDTGKQVEVQCLIIFINGGSRCKGSILHAGQRWGERGGKIYNRIIKNYDNQGWEKG